MNSLLQSKSLFVTSTKIHIKTLLPLASDLSHQFPPEIRSTSPEVNSSFSTKEVQELKTRILEQKLAKISGSNPLYQPRNKAKMYC